jgi:hypothetical protein
MASLILQAILDQLAIQCLAIQAQDAGSEGLIDPNGL